MTLDTHSMRRRKKKPRAYKFIGLDPLKLEAPFSSYTEISWRLGAQYWGKSYTIEGAKAVLQDGFTRCGLKKL